MFGPPVCGGVPRSAAKGDESGAPLAHGGSSRWLSRAACGGVRPGVWAMRGHISFQCQDTDIERICQNTAMGQGAVEAC